MEIWKWVFVGVIWYAGFVLSINALELGRSQRTERISAITRRVKEEISATEAGQMERDDIRIVSYSSKIQLL